MFGRLFRSEDKTPTSAGRRSSTPRASRERTRLTRQHNVRMNVADLRVGMFVVELDKPWEESSFLFQGLELKSPLDILAVQNECAFVWVDFDEFSWPEVPRPEGPTPAPGVGATRSVELSVEDEFDAAREVHTLASEAVSALFEEIRLGAGIDGGNIKQAVDGCVDSILRNPDASIWLTRIQVRHQATAQHSLNVAALSIVMARSMGLSLREMEDVGVCGMLHDVGKTSLSTEVLNKTGRLAPDEVAEMQKHARYGHDILVSTPSVASGAADVAHAHHEQPDGKGYPRRLDGDDIPLYARIVAIAEAYDTMTINQPYRAACSPSDALQELYSLRGKQFDEGLVIRFIEAVGIFPPGSIVEMLNGDIGIVLANTSDKLRPRVIIILDRHHEPMPQRIVDLSQHDADGEGTMYQIRTTHSDGSFGIDVGDFQRAGLRMG